MQPTCSKLLWEMKRDILSTDGKCKRACRRISVLFRMRIPALPETPQCPICGPPRTRLPGCAAGLSPLPPGPSAWRAGRRRHAHTCGAARGSPGRAARRASGRRVEWEGQARRRRSPPGSPALFLFGAGRSGSCAGVARTLLISQCWDGASWARHGGGRPQPVPGGGGSSSSSRPAGLPFCLARHVPGRLALS